MAVVLETTLGDITVDLFLKERPRASLNFLKLCKLKYYNFNLFHTIQRGFIAQTGDPTGLRQGGESIYGVLEGPLKRYFECEKHPKIKHTRQGLLSFVGNDEHMIGSSFFITLGEDLSYLDEKHCVFGEVMEGLDVLDLLNETICDTDNKPYKDIRITHTVILEDPFNDLPGMKIPERSPSPNAERLQGGRIAADEDLDDTEGKNATEVSELLADREAKARATILEMVGDIPDAEMAPPENVLFVCKLNPVTTDDDLEIIFSRFGKIVSCEVIRDKKSEESLQYAFVEFDNPKSCETAYFKMDNVLIDDRRIHVDFSQSVAKVKWHGKGRGVTTYDDHGRKTNKDSGRDLGKGIYKRNTQPKSSHKEEKRGSRPTGSTQRHPERKWERSRDNKGDRRERRVPERNRRNERDRDYERDRERERKRERHEADRDRNRHYDSRETRDDSRRHTAKREHRDERRQRTRSRDAKKSQSKRARSASPKEHKKKYSKDNNNRRSDSDSSTSAEEHRKKSKKSKKKKSKA